MSVLKGGCFKLDLRTTHNVCAHGGRRQQAHREQKHDKRPEEADERSEERLELQNYLRQCSPTI